MEMMEGRREFGYTSTVSGNIMSMHFEFVKRIFVLVVIISGVLGSCLNSAFVFSFIKDDEDNSATFAYIHVAGICEFLLTSFSMTLVGIVIQSDILTYCRYLHTLTETLVYTYSLLMLISCFQKIVTVFKLKRIYNCLYVPQRPYVVIPLVTLVSFITAYLGVYHDLDFDYCQRKHTGNIYFRTITNVFLYVIISIATIVLQIVFFVKDPNGEHFVRFSTNCIYYITLLAYFGSWYPHLIFIYCNPELDNVWLSLTISLGLLRSCFWSNFTY